MSKKYLDLFNGMRVVAFVSFVFGISTFIVCGWTFLSNRLQVESKLVSNPVVLTPKGTMPDNACAQMHTNSTSDSNFRHSYDAETKLNIQVFDTLRSTLIRCSIIVVLLTVLQILSSAYIVGSSMQGCKSRARIWFTLNSIVNVAILLCLSMPLMYQIQHSHHLQVVTVTTLPSIQNSTCAGLGSYDLSQIPKITHMNSFYLGVGADFIVQFFGLITCLLLLRFDGGNVHYRNVENM